MFLKQNQIKNKKDVNIDSKQIILIKEDNW